MVTRSPCLVRLRLSATELNHHDRNRTRRQEGLGPQGSMVMHAADKPAGAYIPHFCYHKKLSIAANRRMCLVERERRPS